MEHPGARSSKGSTSCAGCHQDLGTGVQIRFANTSICDSCILIDFLSPFCCEDSRSTLDFLCAHHQPWYLHGNINRRGLLETWGWQYPVESECQTSLPMAAQTPAHLKVRSLLTWSLSEALFLLGKTLCCSPSMGRGSPPHPVPLSHATAP